MRTLHTAALICLTTERFHYAICQLKTAVKKNSVQWSKLYFINDWVRFFILLSFDRESKQR